MNDEWRTKHYSFFQNRVCEYFPCHDTEKPEDFNCLFCYCPLYALGDRCGGGFQYTEKGVKDCTKCLGQRDQFFNRGHSGPVLIHGNGRFIYSNFACQLLL